MNSLGKDINGLHVVLSEKFYSGPLWQRIGLCTGGFGASRDAWGGAVFLTMVHDGQSVRVGGNELARLATDAEVDEARKVFNHIQEN